MAYETKIRSLIKTIIYRMMTVVCIDYPVVYLGLLYLGYDTPPYFAMSISLLFEITHTVFYYIYERVWCKIRWGRK